MFHRMILTAAIAASFVALNASPSQAQVTVGRKVSTALLTNSGPVTNAGYTDFLAVAVPTSYRSKSNVLKVTTTYLASCGAGGSLYSHVEVGGLSIADGTHSVECEPSQTVRVTKVYILPKESEGGSPIAPGATVVVKLSSEPNIGCGALHGVMTVEALK